MRAWRSRSIAVVVLVVGLLVPAVASADPVPTTDYELPFCGIAPDDDGRYCIVSLTRDGVAQPQHPGRLTGNVPPRIDGQRYSIGVDAGVQPQLGGAYLSIRRYDWERLNEAGAPALELAAAPGTYRIEINTGDLELTGLYGRMAGYTVTRSTTGTGDHVIVVEGSPVDVATHSACTSAACADDLVAEQVLPSFNAYLTDWTGQFPPANWGSLASVMVEAWRGFEVTSNVLNAPVPQYDRRANAIVLAMSAPHFASAGVRNLGEVDMFLPYEMLRRSLDVPNPRSLGSGAFVIRRDGSSAAVPATVTHSSSGLRLRVSGITFSAPTYRIRVKPTRPGAPTIVRARRLGPTAASIAVAPTTAGGRPIVGYVVTCSAPARMARVARSARRTLVVRGLAPGVAYTCRAAARNSIGVGPTRSVRLAKYPPRTAR